MVAVLARACDVTMPRRVKRLRTFAAHAYRLGGGCSEHDLRKSETNDGCRSPLQDRVGQDVRCYGCNSAISRYVGGDHRGFFPRHDLSPWPPFVGQPRAGAGDKERVTDVELTRIAKSLSVGKAAGSNGLKSRYCRGSRDVQVCYAEIPGRKSFPRSLEYAEPGSIDKSGETTRRPVSI